MHHFFVNENQIDDKYVTILGNDVNHIKNVLRMKPGEEILVSNGVDREYYCKLESFDENNVKALIINVDDEGSELDTEFYLFQCLPKGDKMELIIQKAVELGVKEIIPVASKRAVVKLDEKKAESKVKRWNAISESAAKQSKRIIVPKVSQIMNFKEAVSYCRTLDMGLIPYERYRDMSDTRTVIDRINHNMKVGIFIGPEGGFDDSEVQYAVENGMERVSLGKRILRTETAGLAILSILMFKMEQ